MKILLTSKMHKLRQTNQSSNLKWHQIWVRLRAKTTKVKANNRGLPKNRLVYLMQLTFKERTKFRGKLKLIQKAKLEQLPTQQKWLKKLKKHQCPQLH